MGKNKSTLAFLLSCFCSGILLWFAWPERGFAPIIFFAWVPMLLVEHALSGSRGRRMGWKIFGYFYLTLFTWNALTTWWIYNSTDVGSVVAIAANSLLMALVWQLFHVTKKYHGSLWGYTSLISFWMAFEYIHYNWEISWPWLTLGNVFATRPDWVQWYEYTGVLGGTLWILLINLFVFKLAQGILYKDLLLRIRKINIMVLSFTTFLLVLTPIVFSLYLYNEYTETGEPTNLVIVQPNIDPYNEKFNGTGPQQLDKLLSIASVAVDSSTEFLIGPETALADGLWEENMMHDQNMRKLKKYLHQFPKLNIIAGMTSFKSYGPDEKISTTARKFKDANAYYDAYNSAFMICSFDTIQVYHKSKLVPGVEKMPYPKIFGFLENYAIKLGGTSGSLGTQKYRTNFISSNGVRIAPAICYESIYGGFMCGYIRSGAEFIAVITNDGWWGNTPGFRQHMNYARLRAVEFRKSIARSANTGISCIINQRGDIIQQTPWWKEDIIKGTILRNKTVTFYAKHGDYLGFLATFISGCILAFHFTRRLLSR